MLKLIIIAGVILLLGHYVPISKHDLGQIGCSASGNEKDTHYRLLLGQLKDFNLHNTKPQFPLAQVCARGLAPASASNKLYLW